jgi:manganese-dependent inorganic pyrophosphatase
MPHQPLLQRRQSSLVENETPLSTAVSSNSGQDLFLELIKERDETEILSYRISSLQNCVWVGHTNTDMDSIGSAIGAALLFNGIASKASEQLNGETLFVLNKFQVEEPPLFKTLSEEQRQRVCLVDHNQITQMAEGVETKFVKAIIDHHALQKNTLTSDVPIIVDIKPWGSTCTIIARQFYKEKRKIPQKIASVLLAGILSDTLNLRSPTTTEIDKLMVSMLSHCARFNQTEVNELACEMFKAKALAINELSDYAIIMGDHKTFSLMDADKETVKLGFGVIETTFPDTVLSRSKDLLNELRAIRKELKLDFSYCAVVDTINLQSILLFCGPGEGELAKRAFPDAVQKDEGMLRLGSRVSRKLDFIPALDKCLQVNDVQLGQLVRKQTEEDQSKDFGQVVVHTTDHHGSGCCMPTRPKPKLKNVIHSITFMNRLKAAAEKTEQDEKIGNSLIEVPLLITIGLFVLGAIAMTSAFRGFT